jgi:hypothetical protein
MMRSVVDGTSSGLRQMADFDISGVKPSTYVSRMLEVKVMCEMFLVSSLNLLLCVCVSVLINPLLHLERISIESF